MTIGLLTASYIISSVLFILALGGLSNQEKAKRAIWYGIIGMAIAVIATILGKQVFHTRKMLSHYYKLKRMESRSSSHSKLAGR